jgi:hypothetical protein
VGKPAPSRVVGKLDFGTADRTTQQDFPSRIKLGGHSIGWSKIMLKDITAVKYVRDYKLRIKFEDGVEGVIDVATLVEFKGVFAPLVDPHYFAQVAVNPEIGTICWPNDADLDPDVLYSEVTGEPLPILEIA